MMDMGSLYMLLQGGGMGGLGGQQPPPQQGGMPILGRMGRMTAGGQGFGSDVNLSNSPILSASAYRDVPVSHGGVPMHPDMLGGGMPILNASAAPQQSRQPQAQPGQQAGSSDMMKYMMLTGGLDNLFQALRGS